MKKIFSMGLISFAILVLAAPTGSIKAAESGLIWKVHAPFMPGTWERKSAQTWADDIIKMSGGRLKITLSGPMIGEPWPDLHPFVENGDIDAGYTWPGIVIGRYPAATLFAGTPAFFDLTGYLVWMNAYGGKELWQEIYRNSLKILPAGMYWAKVGGWSNKKVETLNDFTGLKYRLNDRAWHRTGGSIWEKILSELGASPLKEPSPAAARAALFRGAIDAAEQSTPWSDLTFNFHKVSKYCYFPGLQDFAGFFELIVNNQKWESLPPDLKEIVRGVSDAATARAFAQWSLDDAKAMKMLKEEGKVQVTKFSKEIQQEILDRFIAHYDAVQDPMFQKVWNSQKEFMKIYIPYMRLQQTDAEMKMK
jgi:TRAP-type mannitol/chloroaromatic compound transport system substrate-binding protein